MAKSLVLPSRHFDFPPLHLLCYAFAITFGGPTKVSLFNPADSSGLENGSVFCLRFVFLEEDDFEKIPRRYEPIVAVIRSCLEDVSGQGEGIAGLCAICKPPETKIR